jgi:hypothetical protein
LAEGATESSDLLIKIILLDDAVRPNGLHDLFSGNHSLPVAYQDQKGLDRFGTERDRLSIPPQDTLRFA